MLLVGRDQEIALLSRALEAVREGPVFCAVNGDAGIGKTALWIAALEAAESLGYRILACRPTRSETQLVFMGLGDLLDRVPDTALDGLAPPLRRALDVALLKTAADGPTHDHRAVGVALLEVVRNLAASGPVVVAIDDVQWLDPATAGAVEHVVRRLRDERVAALFAMRTEPGDPLPLGLPESRTTHASLSGLSQGALHRLIRTRTGLALPRPLLHRVEQVSSGNPFYALQIARVLIRNGGVLGPGERLPVPESLTELAASDIRQLPADVRTALALVAILAQPTPAVVEAALPDGLEALAKAEEKGLIEVRNGRIHFAHPLFAAAAYAATPAIRRRKLHNQLSTVVTDVEQRAWHLALAGERPDAAVAGALEEAAVRAQARGGYASAAQLWELAALRTPDSLSAKRFGRMAAAGAAMFHAGDTAHARELLQTTIKGLPAGQARSAVLLELSDVAFGEGGTWEAADLCERALAEAGHDRRLSIMAAVRGAWYRTHDSAGQLRSAEQAARLLRDEDAVEDPELYACVTLVHESYRFTNGLGFDRARVDRAYALVSPDSLSWQADWARMAWRIVMKFVDLAQVPAAYAAEYELFRSVGDESAMATLSTHMSEVDCWLGDWPRAREHAERSLELLEHCGQHRWGGFALYAKALVAAHTGELTSARAAANEGLGLATEAHDPWVSVLHLGVLGFIELSVGDMHAADGYLSQAAEITDSMGLAEPARHRFHADQFEAAIALGDLDRASALLDRLSARVAAAPYPWLLAMTARCEGLLLTAQGDLDGANAALLRALDAHESLPMPFERSRTLLIQGRLLRRRKEKLASRTALLEAQQIFDTLGAPLWTAQAVVELRTLGLPRAGIGELTPAEERIARLVAGGLTNREVAAAAFVSAKTVEANLSRIYRKLGVTSRRELSKLDMDRHL